MVRITQRNVSGSDNAKTVPFALRDRPQERTDFGSRSRTQARRMVVALPEIRLLQAAIAVARELNFSRAAEPLHIAQSTFSKQTYAGLRATCSSYSTASSRRSGLMHPWKRRPGESPKTFEAFECHCGFGASRSLFMVSQQLVKSTTLLSGWSMRPRWVARCRAWGAHQSRYVNEHELHTTAEMRRRMITQAIELRTRAMQRVLKMTDMEIAALSPYEVCLQMRTGHRDVAKSPRDRRGAQRDPARPSGSAIHDSDRPPRREHGWRAEPGPDMASLRRQDRRVPRDYPVAVVIA